MRTSVIKEKYDASRTPCQIRILLIVDDFNKGYGKRILQINVGY